MPDDTFPTDLSSATLAIVERFNDAFGRQDVDAIMLAMTENYVFDSTNPSPDGECFEGQAAVRAAWEAFFTLVTCTV